MRQRWAFNGVLVAVFVKSVVGRDDDIFNYGSQTVTRDGRMSFGQPEWKDVTCSTIDTCVSDAECEGSNCTSDNVTIF
jgi:hypothetical protein